MATTIEQLCADIKAAPARQRWEKVQALKLFMQNHTEASIIDEIRRINDMSIANQLIGAGLGVRAISALLARKQELENPQ